jgi:hypothetical protein
MTGGPVYAPACVLVVEVEKVDAVVSEVEIEVEVELGAEIAVEVVLVVDDATVTLPTDDVAEVLPC